jgi:hypothetical protein
MRSDEGYTPLFRATDWRSTFAQVTHASLSLLLPALMWPHACPKSLVNRVFIIELRLGIVFPQPCLSVATDLLYPPSQVMEKRNATRALTGYEVYLQPNAFRTNCGEREVVCTVQVSQRICCIAILSAMYTMWNVSAYSTPTSLWEGSGRGRCPRPTL